MGYRLAKPRPDGTQHIEFGGNEFLDRLAALIPPPRRHRHRYHGVLAPNAALRGAVSAHAGQALEGTAQPAPAEGRGQAPERWRRRPAKYLWAALIARIYAACPCRARAVGPRCA